MDLIERYKDKVFEGSTFPDAEYKSNVNVVPNKWIVNEYLPIIKKMVLSRGMETLCTIMAIHEGFYPKTRSYVNKNPGNIGNTDSGKNKKLPTLADGIKLQVNYINGIIAGTNKSYPMGKPVFIKPFYSKEIANNPQYGLPAYLPGYKFTFTGQLDQFVKIYSTGARAGNSYINIIVSYFKKNGMDIKPDSKIQDIVKL